MKPEEIKDLRRNKKLTQTKLGELCGAKKSAVSLWESGKNTPSGPALKMLHQLRDGDLIVSQVSELETKLLDKNVEVGKFKSREEYLTESLKYLIMHEEFMPIDAPAFKPLPAITDPAEEAELERKEHGGEASTRTA